VAWADFGRSDELFGLGKTLLPVFIGCFLLGAVFGAFATRYAGAPGFAAVLLFIATALILSITTAPPSLLPNVPVRDAIAEVWFE